MKQSSEYHESHSLHKNILFTRIASIERRYAWNEFFVLTSIKEMQSTDLWYKAFFFAFPNHHSFERTTCHLAKKRGISRS